MGRKATSLIVMRESDEPQSTDLVRREPSEEEVVFQQFCDCVDAHLLWKGLPPIASSEEERREKAMMYMLRSIEAYRWFAELVSGLDVLESLLGGSQKRKQIADANQESERMVRNKPRFVVRVDRGDDAE